MSRVYNMLTGLPRPAGVVDGDVPWTNSEDAPYVEIGGPGGPVFSPLPTIPSRTLPDAQIEPKTEPARPYPRLVSPPSPAYLSVQFHDVNPRGALKVSAGPDPGLVSLHHPEHAVSAEYRTLQGEIRKQLPEATSRVLMFTAVSPEAGATTVLLNLAVTLARDAKVVVVDANVARPGVAAKLAVKPFPGLCEVLAQHVPLAWAVQTTPAPGLHVIASGDATDATPRAVCGDLPRLLSQLRQWFDWVVVDGGVWGGMPERDAACPSADAVYLVTRETDADRPEFLSVRGWVKELGGLLRGYITTRA